MKYAIFGAGIIGEQILIEYWEKLDIEIIFDNNREGDFYGWEIIKPKHIKNIFIIVTSNRYLEIREQLLELGYLEFFDFVPYQIFNKKMAIVYGNCHIHGVKEYLEQKKVFAEDYGFYPFPMIQSMGLMQNHKYVLQHCKLFIHQSIREENKFGKEFASENMKKYLPEQCQIISIPNLYRMPKCFFPQQKIDDKKNRRGVFCFTSGEDENIEKWVQNGKTEDEIKAYMVKGGVYKKQEILDMWKDFKEKLIERENNWDIKISDYIFSYYKKKKLFYERVHISNVLIKEIASRILRYMGYNENIIYELPIWHDNHEMFIYQDVVEALELEFEQKYIRVAQKHFSLNKYDMDIDEYIHQIYKWNKYKRNILKI